MGAALRRLGTLVGVLAGGTALVSALAGLALGADAGRSVAVGLYVVGCFLVVLGLFAGLRGPLRPRGGDEERHPLAGLIGFGLSAGGVRSATPEERADTLATAWLFLSLGVVLVGLGVAVDGRFGLL